MILGSLFSSSSASHSGPATVVAAGTRMTGHLEGAETVVIAGTLIGDLTAKRVVIERGGRIEGEVRADALLVAGTLDGSCAVEALAVTASGALHGEAAYGRLEVAAGAELEARCLMRAAPVPVTSRNPASPAKVSARQPMIVPALRTA